MKLRVEELAIAVNELPPVGSHKAPYIIVPIRDRSARDAVFSREIPAIHRCRYFFFAKETFAAEHRGQWQEWMLDVEQSQVERDDDWLAPDAGEGEV